MAPASAWTSLLWFLAILAMIPLALWLFKRSTGGMVGTAGPMRTVATLPIGQNQRLVTVEVGQGDEKRWLVLGVTPQNISTLYTLSPQPEVPAASQAATPFAQLMSRVSQRKEDGGDR